MATKPRAKMVQRDATLDDILASGRRYQQFAEDHPAEAPPPAPSGAMRRVLGDGGIALAKGVIGVPEAAVGLADLATGGQAGKFLENEGGAIGFRPKMAKQVLDTYKSPEQQAADQAVQQAQGLVDTTVAALRNPSVVLGSVAESLPVMLGGGVIARSLIAGAAKVFPRMAAGMATAEAAPFVASQGARATAANAPVIAGAAGEGIVTAGSQAESIRQETPDGLLTGQQAALAGGSGLFTGMLGYLGGKVAQRLGIADIDTMLAGKAGPEVTKGFTRRVLEGAVSEGLLEELPQSVQEQVAQNMALGKPLGEGVAQAAVLGALAGGLMGAGGNAISHGGQVRREKVDGTGAASRAINAGLEDTAQQADAIQAAATPPVQPAAGPAPGADIPAAGPALGPGLDAAAAPPADIGAAIAQREADRPAPPTGEPMPGEPVLTSMDNAMRAQQRAGEGAEIVPVAGGLVVRKVDAETGEIAPAAPELPGIEPAPADPDPLPDDILAGNGKPFYERAFAVPAMKRMGDGWTIAKINGGFAVRKLASVAAPIDANAHQAATSPTNDTPEPTEAQKKAGNYALGHHKLAGLDLSIENPAGSMRRGTDRDGKAWENQLQSHYGYIKGTIGNDKDHVDAFVKPGAPDEWAGTVFVVDQVHPDTGRFDEHKAMLGFDSIEEAKGAYRANYAKGWKGLKTISAMPAAEFKTWVKDGPKNKPLAPWSVPTAPTAPTFGGEVMPDRWWGSDLPTERESILLAAGWKPGSPGIDAMKGKRWDEFTPSQKARVGNAIEAKAAAAKGGAATDQAPNGNGGSEAAAGQPAAATSQPAPQADAKPAPTAPRIEAPAPAAATKPAAAAAGPASLEKNGLVKTKTVFGTHAYVRQSDLDGDRAMVRMFTADGKSNGVIHRENLDPTGEKRTAQAKEDAGNPMFDVITRKRGATFSTTAAAQRELNSRGLQETHEVTPAAAIKAGMDGFALRKKSTATDASPAQAAAFGAVEADGLTAAPEGAREKRARLIAERDAAAAPATAAAPAPAVVEVVSLAGLHAALESGKRVHYDYAGTDGRTLWIEETDKGWVLKDRGDGDATTFTKGGGGVAGGWSKATAIRKASEVAEFRFTKWKPTVSPATNTTPPATKGRADKPGPAKPESAPLAKDERTQADATTERERDLRALSHAKEQPGDVMLGNDKFVTLAEAKAAAQQAVDDGELDPSMPFQFNRVLDIAPRDWQRMVKEMTGKAYDDPTRRGPTPAVDKESLTTAPTANTIFTEDAAAAARSRLKAKLGRLNSGLDPETMMDGITLAGYHVEKGARRFAAFARAMVDDLGDAVKPYLIGWYMAVRSDPRAGGMRADMDKASAVEDLDVDDVLATTAPAASTEVATPAAAPAEAKNDGTLRDHLRQAITDGKMPKDNPALRKMVESFDGVAPDQPRMKVAQEALEAAIVQMAREVVAKKEGDRTTFDILKRMYDAQPNLNIRTSDSIERQAYSTPAPLAYLGARLADVTRQTTMYEPTGGNGMLAITASPGNVTTTELDPQRADSLKAQGFNVTQGDALEANVPDKSKDRVMTNPPFGPIKNDKGESIKVKFAGYTLGQIDHLIAARALATMKDDGNATLIIGANKAAGQQSNNDLIFFNWLYGNYNVTSHFEVEGDLYQRQGAGWPVRVITIKGRMPSVTTAPNPATIQRANTWSEVYEQFQQGMDAGRPAASAGASPVGAGPGTSNDAGTVSGAAAPKTGRADSGRPEGRTAGDGNVPRERAGPVGNRAAEPAARLGERSDAVGSNDRDPGPVEDARIVGAEAAANPAGNPRTAVVTSTDPDNQFQTRYIARSERKDEGVLIPVNMAGPTQDALNRLEDEVGNIDQFAASELGYKSVAELHRAFMGLQVDSVASAISQIKAGKGIIIADQTGVGKGRQAAGIIRWAARNGKTPIFVTVKPSLFTDMYGDLHDIGTDDIQPLLMNSGESIKGAGDERLFANQPALHKRVLEAIASSGRLPNGRNALFMTYSQINVDNIQRKAVMALAPNAVFVLDESHNAGGASATGEFIKGALDLASGVTYLSATYAKRPDNMPVYFKTDIGDAVADDDTLMAAMAAGGLPLQTVVSNNLVKAGQMFRRERSYDGVSIESRADTEHKAEHVKLSDETTLALRAIVSADRIFHHAYVKALQEELAKEGSRVLDMAGNQAQQSVDHTQFSSVVHNFVRQMLLGLKAQEAANDAIRSIKRGEKPLIAVEGTMGSFLSEHAENNNIKVGDSLGSFDYRTVLSRALERSRYIVRQLPNGDKVKEYIPMGKLDPLSFEAYTNAQAVIDKLKIDIPVSPIDWMRDQITKAGYTVAEVTGRNLSVDYGDPKRPKLAQIDQREQKDKVRTTRQFNDGTLDAIILNVAGSTGISLHASEKFKDKRQRHMIVAQAAQDINIFMQMLGRVHRTGQVVLPKYTLLSADLPAEIRPTALLSGKMKSLNANTSSNTESATSVKAADMLNKYGDTIVQQYLADNFDLAQALDLTVGEADADGVGGVEDIARKATGRLALMPVKTQEQFYAEVEEQYQALIDYLNKTNQNDLEPRTFDFDAQETKSAVLFEGQNKASPFGEDALYGEYSVKAQGKAMSPEDIRAAMAEHLAGKTAGDHLRAMAAPLQAAYNNMRDGMAEEEQKAKADVAARSGAAFLDSHKIGSMFRVEISGESYNAIVTNIRSTHKATGNPFSQSKIQVTIAVNGALRSVTLPATQFSKIEVSQITGGYGSTIEAAFKEGPPNERETAKIVTGNLLGAYGEIEGARGSIITFSKSDGTTEQGILLPKAFNFTKDVRQDYRLKTADDVLKFLTNSSNENIDRFGINSRDSVLRVLPSGQNGITIQVPKSKAKGGKYFLDKALREAAGDFVSSGNFMRATVTGEARAKKALEVLMQKGALYALPSMAQEARQIVGDPEAPAGDPANPSMASLGFKQQTETPAFKRWFGASVVTEDGKADGKPLVVYHGTNGDFKTFDDERFGATDGGGLGRGFYFSERPTARDTLEKNWKMAADTYGNAIYPVYLNIKNPATAGRAWALKRDGLTSTEVRDKLIAQGHDGVVLTSPGVTTYVAFRPEQIKSATGNNGAFDPANPSIVADLSRVSDQVARQGYERADVKRMQAARRLQGILADKAAGKLTPEEFDAAVAALADQMADVSATKQANRLMTERQRGADILREKLIRARRTGDLDEEAVGLGLWLVDKNPSIASDLSVSILTPKDGAPAGDYNPVTRVIRLFKETGNADTIAHEILHHTERMMPPELQGPIRAEWAKQVETSLKAAQDQPAVLAALQEMMLAAAGNQAAYQRTVKNFKDGVLDYGTHYQLFNASEFWAVNGARILADRYADQGSWVAQAAQWLRDLVQYMRGALGLRSDAPVLRALANVTDPGNFGPERGGDFMSDDMLSQGNDVRQAPAAGRATTGTVPADTNAPGPQGGERTGANQGNAVTESNMPPERAGFTRLYHAGSDPITGGYFQTVPSGGVFDGMFALTSGFGNYGTGAKYFADIADGKILTQHDLDYEISHKDTIAALRKAMPWLADADVDFAYEAVIEDKHNRLDEGDLTRIFREDSFGEASWEAQRVRGLVAKELGYQAVQMSDENGTSTLLVAGTPLTRVIPNEQSAPVPGGASGRDSGGKTYASLGFKEAFSNAKASARERDLAAGYKLGDLMEGNGRLSWWHSTVGTMMNLAKRSPAFRRVFDATQSFISDATRYSSEAAKLAPQIMPRLDKTTDALPAMRLFGKDVGKEPLSQSDTKAVGKAVFDGTLKWGRDTNGKARPIKEVQDTLGALPLDDKAHQMLRDGKIAPKVLRMWQGLPQDQYEAIIESKFEREYLQPGVVFKDSELKQHFGLDERQIGLYHQGRAAIDKSLTDLSISQMLKAAGDDALALRDELMEGGSIAKAERRLTDHLGDLAEAQPDRDESLRNAIADVQKVAEQARRLITMGYAPLSRFGQYTLEATLPNGERFFTLHDTDRARNKMAREMAAAGATGISTGTLSQEEFKLLQGISPESYALFGEILGLDSQGSAEKDVAFQEFIRRAVANQSAMKRFIHRKGIEGYSEDIGRVLAQFIFSNGRLTSGNLHKAEMLAAVNAIPKDQGQLKDAAVRLRDYVQNPQEEAPALRGLLFSQYLGGSIASAIVNATQPFTMTLPFLSQWGVRAAAQQMTRAVRDVNRSSTGDAALDTALKHAEEDGTVSPQEIHNLQAQAMGRASLVSGDGTKIGNALATGNNLRTRGALLWGKMFSVAEQFNRRVTFIAAYRTAVAQEMGDPAAFARNAVNETQGIYNKGNKPEWARGAIGSVLFTFKQYTVNYLEMLNRMWNAGEDGSPERAAGRKAVLVALAVLFLMAGADGLPFAENIDELIDAFLQRLGYNIRSKRARKEFFANIVGQGGAEFLSSGISGLPGAPIDISGRMSVGKPIPGLGLLQHKTDHSRDLMELAGPVADLGKRALMSADDLSRGELLKARMGIAPTAIRNVAKAVDMADKGMYRDDRGRKVVDTSLGEAIAKGIGFQPRSVAQVQEATVEAQRSKSQYQMAKADISEKMARAIFENNQGLAGDARGDVAAWNRKNPDQPMEIAMPAVRHRVSEMRKTKEQRVADTAPKAIRAKMRKQLAEDLQ